MTTNHLYFSRFRMNRSKRHRIWLLQSWNPWTSTWTSFLSKKFKYRKSLNKRVNHWNVFYEVARGRDRQALRMFSLEQSLEWETNINSRTFKPNTLLPGIISKSSLFQRVMDCTSSSGYSYWDENISATSDDKLVYFQIIVVIKTVGPRI